LPISGKAPIEGGTATAELISASGGACRFVSTDVADGQSIEDAVEQAVAGYGRLDIMVNNAAIYTSTGLLETSSEDWRRVMAVNVEGVFLGASTRDAVPEAGTPR
jgi:NAD(P)-dependent dehydrogenase (short-subunit alcohol dehydrogenase family)